MSRKESWLMSLFRTNSAIIDSGTSMLVGPKNEVEAIASMFGATRMNNLWVIDCWASPSLAFRLGGQDFVIQGEELIIQQEGQWCVLGLQEGRAQGPWILGDVFMRKFYVQFDWGQ